MVKEGKEIKIVFLNRFWQNLKKPNSPQNADSFKKREMMWGLFIKPNLRQSNGQIIY